MASPVVLTNATLADGTRTTIALAGERIGSLGAPPTPGEVAIDLGGRLVLPALIDAHVHLDKTLLGLPWQPHRAANSVQGRIAAEKDMRRTLAPPVEACGAHLLAAALAQGTTAVRSHVDIDDQTGLANVEAVLRLRQAWAGAVDVQVVAFPQSGIVRCAGVAEQLREALEMGCDLVGGLDPVGIDQDLDGHLDVVFGLAERHGVGVDIHLHDQGEPGVGAVEAIIARTNALGFGGKVTVSHAFCLGAMSADAASRLADRLARAGVAILTSAPGAAPMPPVPLLRQAGVWVMAGSDNIRDAWSPFGNASMLERCWLVAYRCGLRREDEIAATLDLATSEPAAALGIADYGLKPGGRADLIVLAAAHAAQAVIERPRPDLVLRHGRVAQESGVIATAAVPRLAVPALPGF